MPSPPSSSHSCGADSSNESDRIRRLLAGDGTALEELYDRHARAAYSLARRIVADDGLAQDVVQEVFLAVWRDPARYEPTRGSLSSWLLTMTHHKAVDAVRREESLRRRQDRAETNALTDPNEQPSAEDVVTRDLDDADVRAALHDLPAAQRQAITLAYFGGYTQREVAALTATPLGTVKTRMLAGIRRLRSRLTPPATDRAPNDALNEGGMS